jgi:hypothetical protein
MQRATAEEAATLQSFTTITAEDLNLFNGVYRLAAQFMQEVKLDPNPQMPAYGRHADNWRVLISIADACSAEWGRLAREVAVALAYQAEETESERLLQHCLLVGQAEGVETTRGRAIPSKMLVTKLRALDEAEGEWLRLTQKVLATKLRPFGVRSEGPLWPPGPHNPNQHFGAICFRASSRLTAATVGARVILPLDLNCGWHSPLSL